MYNKYFFFIHLTWVKYFLKLHCIALFISGLQSLYQRFFLIQGDSCISKFHFGLMTQIYGNLGLLNASVFD